MEIENLFYNFLNSNYAQIKLKESSLSTYSNNYERYIKPYFSAHAINEDTITLFTKQLLQFLSAKTVCDVLTLLSNILKCSNLHIPIYKPNFYIETVTVFNETEWDTLQNYCITHLNYFTFCILLSMYSGIRPGELCALTVQSLDLNNNLLKIQQTM